jgi:hypothetical protein
MLLKANAGGKEEEHCSMRLDTVTDTRVFHSPTHSCLGFS